MNIKFILRWYEKSKYFGMKREHIKIFDNFEELLEYRTFHKIKQYEMYRQMV